MFENADIIYAYTRKEAIEDGMQFKVEDGISKEAGMRFPVYLTKGVYDLIDKADKNKNSWSSFDGIMWDIFTMLKYAIKTSVDREPTTDFVKFTVKIVGAGRKKNFEMYGQIGPFDIDDPAPTMTIMLPEDY